LLWVLALILITKITDMGALVLGSIFGKHKLAPVLSPGKTIEGAVGGVVVSMLLAWLLHDIGRITLQPQSSLSDAWDVPKIMFAAGIISVFGILGDLVESAWKRLNHQKNSGNCLPGLGGIYDLTDSLVLSAPVACLLIRHFVFA
jgi:phosphatidate cytidylyltransferase